MENKYTIKFDVHFEYHNIKANSDKEALEQIISFVGGAHQLDLTGKFINNQAMGPCSDPVIEKLKFENIITEITKN